MIAPLSLSIVALAAIGIAYFNQAPKLTDKDTIVLADFTNTTSDSIFDGTLRQGLSVQLEQSPFLSIVPDQQIQQNLYMIGQKPDVQLTPEIAAELCKRTGSAAAIDGSIARIGSRYLLTLKAVNCSNGQSLASTEAQASDKNHVLDALGQTALEIRIKLGESPSTVHQFDTPLAQAATPSLDALEAFSSGQRVLSTTGETEAIPFYKQATELDPNFALAHAWLGRIYGDIGESSIAADSTRKSYELRDRASEAEKYFITAGYHLQVTGNMEKAEQTCKLWAQSYPRSDTPHNFLSGEIYPVVGEHEKGVEEGIEDIRLNPNSPVPYMSLMFNYIALNRLDEAKATYAQALARKMNFTFYPPALYEIAFLQNDVASMAKQVTVSTGQSGVEEFLLALEADTAAYSGHLKDARQFSQGAIDSAERQEEKETATSFLAASALREAWLGNALEARRRATMALAQSEARDVKYFAALAFAYGGDDTQARALTTELSNRFPEDTLVQFNYLPTLRAKLAINSGNTSEALESLRAAAPYELGWSTYSAYNWGSMYPIYVRGETYLAAHQGAEAAAEFQKILDHRGVVVNQTIGALAHLGLARAYVLEGDTAKARAAYQDFLSLWKDADPGIPILIAAKSEYSKLK